MSAEAIVKKRGRPRKVIPELKEVAMPEVVKKTTTRAKSTKAAPKARQSPVTKAPKPIPAKRNINGPAAAPAAPNSSSVAKPTSKTASSQSTSSPAEKKPIVKAEVPPSKILEEMKKVEAKRSNPNQLPTKATSKTRTPASNTKPIASKPAATAPPSAPKPSSKPHIPLAALNSEIVSNISARAGARPNASTNHPLPKNYKSVSRKVTMVLVALPIAICTSYVLWQRLVMGEEKKELVPAPLPQEKSKVELRTEAEPPSSNTS